jgi:hypothetical protein
MPDISAPPRHSLSEIQSAIEAIMMRQSGGKSYDATRNVKSRHWQRWLGPEHRYIAVYIL